MASYPNSIANLVNPDPNRTLYQNSHSQIEIRQNEEIKAIEEELGLGLKGTLDTLASRINVSINPNGTLKHQEIPVLLEDLQDVECSSGLSDGQALVYDSGDGIWRNVDIGGIGEKINVKVVTENYTPTSKDDLIVCNSTLAITINLPSATGIGKIYRIKNINTGIVTIDGDSSDTIDGQATQEIYQWEGVIIGDYVANTWVIT